MHSEATITEVGKILTYIMWWQNIQQNSHLSKSERHKNVPSELVKRRGAEVLRQNVESVSWLLQVVCDKILKERDEIRKELVDMKAEQRENIACSQLSELLRLKNKTVVLSSTSKRKNLEVLILNTQPSGKEQIKLLRDH